MMIQNQIEFYQQHLLHLEKNKDRLDSSFYNEEIKAVNEHLNNLKNQLEQKSIDILPEAESVLISKEWITTRGFIALNHLGCKEYSLIINDGLTIEVLFEPQLIVRIVAVNENWDENINLAHFITYTNIPNCNTTKQLENLYFALTAKVF